MSASTATAAAIPGAELLLLEGGTHYTPLEFPEVINRRIDRFLAERLDRVSAAPGCTGSSDA